MIKTVKIYYLFMWLLAAGQVHGQELAKGEVEQSDAGGQEVPKLRIDPSKAYGGGVSEYFDEVEYIPLETTKESLFGEISRLIVTDSSLVIADYDTHAILFFLRDGKFIGKQKYKQDQWPSVSLDQTGKRIIISTYRGRDAGVDLQYFGLLGNELSEPVKPQNDKLINYDELISLGDGYLLAVTGCYVRPNETPKDSTIYLVKIYKDKRIYKSFLPYNLQKDYGICRIHGRIEPPNVITNGHFYISTPLEHKIYSITRDTALLLYQIVFLANKSYPIQEIKKNDKTFLDSLSNNWRNTLSLITHLSNIYFRGSQLFFKINQRGYISDPLSDVNGQYNFMYDIKSHRLVSLERITPDSISHFLPHTSNSMGSRREGYVYKNNWLYNSVSSLKMFAAHDKNEHRNPQYPPVLKKYFKEEDRKSNPVIVRMKLKE